MSRALVTGACGFVGRRFVNRLLELGYDVVGVDNYYTGKPLNEWLHKPKKHFDLHDMDARVFFHSFICDFDLVVHLAAIVGGRLNIENDPLAVATDLSIDAEMFNCVVRSKKRPKVIYFSSSAAYPLIWQTEFGHKPLAEELIQFAHFVEFPDMTYGWSKLSGEYLAKFAYEHYGLDVRIYRPFGGYGEDQDLTYPVPAIINRILNKENPVIVWGSGEQQRDFIWIDDVVNAVEKTMNVPQLSGKPLNLGTGRATSFIELAQIACGLAGHKATVTNDLSKPEGVFSRVADITEMKKYYTPLVTLEEGLKTVLESARAPQLVDMRSFARMNYETCLRYGLANDQESL